MKVYIGPYRTWYGPYQIAQKILFWKNKEEDKSVHEFGKRLNSIDWLRKLCEWIESKKHRKIKVYIHNYDVWAMNHTIALIVLPMLRRLQEINHGSPYTDFEDSPHIPLVLSEGSKDNWEDENLHKRWDYILEEMIFAFYHIVNDEWEYKLPFNEADKIQERMRNGFRLFGKYYQSLWD